MEQSTAAVEREVLTQVMKEFGGNKAKAARLLRIDYKTIHTKLKKLGIVNDSGDNGRRKKKDEGADGKSTENIEKDLTEMEKDLDCLVTWKEEFSMA